MRFPVLALAVVATVIGSSSAQSQAETNARAAIRNTITSNPALGPKYVRLVFHDCVSASCDGCVNMNQKDNAGLDVPINALNPIYNQFSSSFSRADIWVLASLEAIEWGVANGQMGKFSGCSDWSCTFTMPKIAFNPGRQDCASSPNNVNNSEDQFLNAETASTADLFAYFQNLFGYDRRKSLALMGAHGFGQAFPQNSGFDISWTLDSWNMIDNFYYHTLVEPLYDWHQEVQRPNGGPAKFVWRCIDIAPEHPGNLTCGFNINADMQLIMDMKPDAQGRSDCQFDFNNQPPPPPGLNRIEPSNRNHYSQLTKKCTPLADVIAIAWEYDQNGSLWASEFAAVFTDLISRNGNGGSGGPSSPPTSPPSPTPPSPPTSPPSPPPPSPSPPSPPTATTEEGPTEEITTEEITTEEEEEF